MFPVHGKNALTLFDSAAQTRHRSPRQSGVDLRLSEEGLAHLDGLQAIDSGRSPSMALLDRHSSRYVAVVL
jgi:hypothetical protein